MRHINKISLAGSLMFVSELSISAPRYADFSSNVNNMKSISSTVGVACSIPGSNRKLCSTAEGAMNAVEVGTVGYVAHSLSTLSGAGIMKGLASLGANSLTPLIGLSPAVTGVMLTSGAGGLATVGLLNSYVYNSNTKADQAARYGTYAGAVTGTVGGVVAISSAGVGGLSAVGITSGLAAIGGSMATGAAIVLAAPAVAAVVTGGALYLAFKARR